MIRQNMIYLVCNDPLFLNDETSNADSSGQNLETLPCMVVLISIYHIKYLENAMAYHG